ncbi:sensor domain-containing diguanylate cyclase [Falsiroseomonas stagni]|uniref:Diguanylate cyclase (GGDEF) domain-containing protein n=1 Tax=Falsiroseomonas stagni DSM 19981 TaxID=1123062 RepID=A0A1I4EH67_9PROT|nr:sensor domain-containing diguanylate cyclase [Falsiroseomonas stagni]SFL04603.1 diguanylate cyclase (GGDEF) domain-containing protein [Falsiroseomonas stagni DSM 19981]
MDVLPDDREHSLASALIDSRARWRDFALLAADMVFETDGAGCFTFVGPDEVLGWRAEALLGRPAAQLLAGGGCGLFRTRQAMRGARIWLNRADGTPSCLDFTVVPHEEGLRGAGRDVTTEERMAEVSARALRRATTLGRLLRLGQRQGDAAAALGAILRALPAALPAMGAALLVPEGAGWRVAVEGTASVPLGRLPSPGDVPAAASRLLLVGAESGACLLAWRDEAQPDFDAEDRDLLEALAMPVAGLHAEALRQQELAQAAHGDALTGLLNRRGFTMALAGRVRPAAGALLFIDLDGLKPLNDVLGHEAGDAALRGMAERLRAASWPGDVAARLGGDEFCLWLEGVESEAAALDRARPIGHPGPLPGWPEAGEGALRASLGIALPAAGEDLGSLMMRADAAMYAVKRAKAGGRR